MTYNLFLSTNIVLLLQRSRFGSWNLQWRKVPAVNWWGVAVQDVGSGIQNNHRVHMFHMTENKSPAPVIHTFFGLLFHTSCSCCVTRVGVSKTHGTIGPYVLLIIYQQTNCIRAAGSVLKQQTSEERSSPQQPSLKSKLEVRMLLTCLVLSL